MMEKRATVAKIKGWYAGRDLKPCRNCWFQKKYETDTIWCCPLGAWYLSEGGNSRGFDAMCAAHDYFGKEYVTGFIEGFDGSPYSWNQDTEYRIGYKDGQSASKQLFPST